MVVLGQFWTTASSGRTPRHTPSEQLPCTGAEGFALLSGPALPLMPRPERHSLEDLIVLDCLLQVLKVGVDTADGSHIRLQQLNVSLLLGGKRTREDT